MHTKARIWGGRISIVVAALLPACSSLPAGPSVLVMPRVGQSLASFKAEDDVCRRYALERLGETSPQSAASEAFVSVVAAVTGLLSLGGAVVDGTQGARVGAALGLVSGTAGGLSASSATRGRAQTQYDHAYSQCMFTQGHRPRQATVGVRGLSGWHGGTDSSSEPPVANAAAAKLRVGVGSF